MKMRTARQAHSPVTSSRRQKRKDRSSWWCGPTTETLERRVMLNAAVSGVVFNDLNANAAQNTGETGLAGWVVYVDVGNTGSFVSTDPNAVTAADGSWSIPNLAAGSYTLREVQQANWRETLPGPNRGWSITLGTTNFTGLQFGNTQAVQVSGTVYSDLTGNGAFDTTDPGLSGWTVYADLNSNGKLDTGEPSTVSAANGTYSLDGIPAGTFKLAEMLQAGYGTVSPAGGVTTLTLAAGATTSAVNFGNGKIAGISGTVYNDANGNKVQDAAELGQSGWTVYVDLNNDGRFDPSIEPSTTSGSTGSYTISNLLPGTYHLREIRQAGWGQTTPTGTQFTLALSGTSLTGENFGNQVSLAVTFTDANLATAVRTALGFGVSQAITQADMAQLTTLNADSNLISNLTGLQYATALQTLTLTPGNWSAAAGTIADLSPLKSLASLKTLTLERSGITAAALTSLGTPAALTSLDLRYDAVANMGSFGGLAKLTNLYLYGNPVTDYSALAGKSLSLDLAPQNLDLATNISSLATALFKLPNNIYSYVLNNFTYQPYNGAMKGPQATLETKAGNDWDLDSLLAGLLSQAGITSSYVSGKVQVAIATVENWLGVTDPTAAGNVLASAGLQPTTILNAQNVPTAIQFNHTWLQATVNGKAVVFDPTWKFRDYQTGLANLLTTVPFDATGYLGSVQTPLAAEYYANQVETYLAANKPGMSLSDVAYSGVIRPQTITSLPTALPYTVIGATTINTSIPTLSTHRVELKLVQGATTLFDATLAMPAISLQRVTIGWASSAGQLIPQLMLDGTVVASGSAITAGSAVQLILSHYDAGASSPSRSFTYNRYAGNYLAVGLDANQFSSQAINREFATIAAADVAAADGLTFSKDDQIGGVLWLAMSKWFFDTDRAKAEIDGLTRAAQTFNSVASGIATSDGTVTYTAGLTIPYVPGAVNVDIANSFHQSVSIDNNTANDRARETLIGYNGSAEEHAVWEQLVNEAGISTIKSLQLAGVNKTPIFTINSGNIATLLPQMTIDISTKSLIQSYIAGGYAVTCPRDPTPLNRWRGVGFIATPASGKGGAYIISGGLASSSVSEVPGTAPMITGTEAAVFEGGSGTQVPQGPPGNPTGNPNDNQTDAKDPINVANGNVTHEETDITLPNIGLPLTFARHYDSQSTQDFGLGTGWSFSFMDRLTFGTGGAVTWMDDLGHYTTFTLSGSAYVVPNTVHGTFTKTASAYTFRDSRGITRNFDLTGRLLNIQDRNGNGLAITYSSGQQIATVADIKNSARKLTFTYTSGHVTSILDFTGRTWTYAYSGNSLTQVSTPGDATAAAAVVKYAYYTDTALGGLLKSITGPDGGVTTFTYYANRRGLRMVDQLGYANTFFYDLNHQRTYLTDERNDITMYDYDAAGEVTRVTYPDFTNQRWTWSNGLRANWTDEFGKVETYTYDSLGNQTKVVDRNGKITTWTFDTAYGNLLSMTKPNGGTWTYTYDAKGNRLSITDAVGDLTKYTYDTRGEILSQVDARGNTQTFTYDAAGDMLTRLTNLPSTDTWTFDNRGNVLTYTDANAKKTAYTYDIIGRRLTKTDPLTGVWKNTYNTTGEVISATDPLGDTFTYAYDLRHRPISMTGPDGTITKTGWNPVGETLNQIDALGRVTQYTYDVRDRLNGTIYADGTSSRQLLDGGGRIAASIDPRGSVSKYTYDNLGRLTKSVSPSGFTTAYVYDGDGNTLTITDAVSHMTTFTYDLADRSTAVKDAAGKTVTSVYDAVGNLISVTDRLGHKTTYTYDALNRRITQTDPASGLTKFTYDAENNLLTATDPLNRVTTNTYDALNRRLTQKDPANGITSWTYDANGNVLSMTDPLGRKTQYSYDKGNQLIATTDPLNHVTRKSYDPVGNLVAVTDADGNTLRNTFDVRNRTVLITDALGNKTAFTYDADGNRTSMTSPLGFKTTYTFDADNRRTSLKDPLADTASFTYDKVGNLLTMTDSLAHVTTYTYDVLNRLLTTKDALGRITSMTYDANGNLLQETDPDGNKTTFTYDALDRTLTKTDALLKKTTYAYDAVGNRTSVTDRDGHVRHFAYDALNRMTSETWLNSSSAVIWTIAYTYDADGELLKASDPNATYTNTYDATGALLTVSNAGTTGEPTVVLTYTYDAVHNLLSRTDTINSVLQGTETYTYDLDNRETSVTQSGASTSGKRVNLTYDADGQLILENRYADTTGTNLVASTKMVYDGGGRLRSINDTHGTAVLDAFALTYDAAGRLTFETSLDGTATYTYDNTNQLTGATYSYQSTENYSYDNNGNRTNTGYTTGTNNRLTSDGKINYTYDAEGNLLTATEIATGKVTTYTWDYRNRLTEVQTKSSAAAVIFDTKYTYDLFNRRIGKSVDADGAGSGAAVVTRYVYDHSNVALQFNASSALTHRYLFGPGQNQVFADETSATKSVLWTLTDQENTVRDLVDNTGAVKNHIKYNAFGVITGRTSTTVGTIFGYTGQQTDTETGLDYYRARYYNPSAGRFISEDPLGLAANDPNVYRYVGNRVTTNVDPTGMLLWGLVDFDMGTFVGGVAHDTGRLTYGAARGVYHLGQNAVYQVHDIGEGVYMGATGQDFTNYVGWSSNAREAEQGKGMWHQVWDALPPGAAWNWGWGFGTALLSEDKAKLGELTAQGGLILAVAAKTTPAKSLTQFELPKFGRNGPTQPVVPAEMPPTAPPPFTYAPEGITDLNGNPVQFGDGDFIMGQNQFRGPDGQSLNSLKPFRNAGGGQGDLLQALADQHFDTAPKLADGSIDWDALSVDMVDHAIANGKKIQFNLDNLSTKDLSLQDAIDAGNGYTMRELLNMRDNWTQGKNYGSTGQINFYQNGQQTATLPWTH